MIWFTSDCHFGHARIIELCHRPFENIEEMDEELIRRWNVCVKSTDTVYHLGDFSFGDPRKYLKRLTGAHITLIVGSHDKNLKELGMKDRIQTIHPLKDEYGNPRTIVMCHFAMRSWPLSHYASWHLFGHHHGKLAPYGLSFDVGVDSWAYAPVSLDEVAEKMAILKPIVDFRKDIPNYADGGYK
jgi:calcineurin-like phosphoesterase family protein